MQKLNISILMNRAMKLSIKYQRLYHISTIFFPILPFDSSENIKKLLIFWFLQGDQKGKLGGKGSTLEAYLGACRTSVMKLFNKSFKHVLWTQLQSEYRGTL